VRESLLRIDSAGERLLSVASLQGLLLANGVEELDVEMAFLYRLIFRRRC
jgi:hypothetical protein